MSETLYLLLALAVIVSYLLLTEPGRTTRPRSDEIAKIAWETRRELLATEERYKRWIDEALRNDSGKR